MEAEWGIRLRLNLTNKLMKWCFREKNAEQIDRLLLKQARVLSLIVLFLSTKERQHWVKKYLLMQADSSLREITTPIVVSLLSFCVLLLKVVIPYIYKGIPDRI